MKEERLLYPDILRVISAFFVILIHVTSVGITGYEVGSSVWMTSLVLNNLSRWCVPVFFMISGMFMLDPEKEVTISRLFKKNVSRMILCIVVWGFFYSLLDQILYGEISLKSLPIAVYGIATGNTGGYHLWFLYTLVILYIETPILRVFTKHADKRQIEYALAVWFLFSIVFVQAASLANELLWFEVSFSYGAITLTGYSGYYLLGYYLHKCPVERTKLYPAIRVVALMLLVVMPLGNVVVAYHLKCSWIEFIHMPLGVGTCMVSVAIFLMAKRVRLNKTGKVARCVRFVARYTFGIYLVHVFFHSMLFGVIQVDLTSGTIFGWSFVIYIISGLTTALLSKIPLVKEIV